LEMNSDDDDVNALDGTGVEEKTRVDAVWNHRSGDAMRWND